MYAISKDGLLSFFDAQTQKFVWKKKLTIPQSKVGQELSDSSEQFDIKYLGGNLLVHSQKQAMLVNTAGHNNLQFDFETMFGQNEGKPLVNIFVYGDNILTIFAYGNQIVIYKDTTLASQIPLDTIDIEVLQMILDSANSQIMILARTKNTLKTYIVSLANNFQVTPQSEKTIE